MNLVLIIGSFINGKAQELTSHVARFLRGLFLDSEAEVSWFSPNYTKLCSRRQKSKSAPYIMLLSAH
jgi:hypothetical protein